MKIRVANIRKKKKRLYIIQYTASGSSSNRLGKRSFSPNGSQNLLTIKHKLAEQQDVFFLFFFSLKNLFCQYISTVCVCLNPISFARHFFNTSNSFFFWVSGFSWCHKSVHVAKYHEIWREELKKRWLRWHEKGDSFHTHQYKEQHEKSTPLQH